MPRPWPAAAALVAILIAAPAAGAAPTGPPTGWALGAQEPRMEGLQTDRTGGPLPDPAMEERATDLAASLRCPVCQGLSIQDSPSPLAQDMKNLIRTQVAAGATDAEVRQYFVSRYGEWVLLEPNAAGFNLLVYLLPALALLGGGALIAVAVRRWTVAGGDAGSQGP